VVMLFSVSCKHKKEAWEFLKFGRPLPSIPHQIEVEEDILFNMIEEIWVGKRRFSRLVKMLKRK